MIQRLSDGLEFQAQALALRSERQRLLASNIANADTPGYVARDLDFGGNPGGAIRVMPADDSDLLYAPDPRTDLLLPISRLRLAH